MKRHLLATLLGGALLVQSPAHAFLSDTEARKSIEVLQQQLQQTQSDLSAARRAIAESSQGSEALKQEIANLRGQIEVMQHELQSAQQRQRDLYVDLDNRLRQLEESRAKATQAANAAVEATLDEAIAKAKAGKHKDAVADLQRFVDGNNGNARQSEALYWLGTSQTALKNYKGAEDAYQSVLKDYAKDAYAPDALFGLAVVANAKGDKRASRGYLLELLERYPESPKAEAAKKALLASP
ncbi:YbgF trimerization domain-containing protein [Chitinibacteraceae bacterium HSL-7]